MMGISLLFKFPLNYVMAATMAGMERSMDGCIGGYLRHCCVEVEFKARED
ncbi:MAG: hypothetical protein ACXWC9_08075 [Pseudobdellovibrionaceae bacterium]